MSTLNDISAALEERPRIDETFDLDQAAEALKDVVRRIVEWATRDEENARVYSEFVSDATGGGDRIDEFVRRFVLRQVQVPVLLMRALAGVAHGALYAAVGLALAMTPVGGGAVLGMFVGGAIGGVGGAVVGGPVGATVGTAAGAFVGAQAGALVGLYVGVPMLLMNLNDPTELASKTMRLFTSPTGAIYSLLDDLNERIDLWCEIERQKRQEKRAFG